MKEIHIWQIKFTLASKQEIVDQVEEWLATGQKGIHLTGVNPEQIVRAQKDYRLRNAIKASDIVNVDGILAVIGLRLKGYNVPERVATPNVMEAFLRLADCKQQKVFFFGAEPSVIEQVVRNIATRYPRLIIAGYQDGFDYDEEQLVQTIAACEPDYLFIALPSPRKEAFILNHKHRLNVGVLYGIGGAFDVLGGKYHRAPAAWQKLNLEWLWRILQNPRQNGARVLKFYPDFIKLMFKS